jgi:RNA-directed DNA polymerase
MIFALERYGPTSVAERFLRIDLTNRPPNKPHPDLALIVRGKVQHVGAVKGWQTSVYRGLAKSLRRVDGTFVPTARFSLKPKVTFHIFCEGKSDYIHLRAALAHFRKSGGYADLELVLMSHIQTGDGKLIQLCRAYAQSPHKPACVFIFDRDNDDIVKEVEEGGLFREWNNGVFSFALPVPAHRATEKKICVELLYKDDTLRVPDSDGRRVFRTAEFTDHPPFHNEGEPVFTALHTRGLIAERVYDMEERREKAISKTRFAMHVEKGEPPYASVDFSGFIGVFDVLRAIRLRTLST